MKAQDPAAQKHTGPSVGVVTTFISLKRQKVNRPAQAAGRLRLFNPGLLLTETRMYSMEEKYSHLQDETRLGLINSHQNQTVVEETSKPPLLGKLRRILK